MIADLHCDLLSYLIGNTSRTPLDLASRAAFPQMEQGGVKFQTLAVFTDGGKTAKEQASKQVDAFTSLLSTYAASYRHFDPKRLPSPSDPKVSIALAIENASGLIGEEEPLENAFSRLQEFQEKAGPILYISLTWNHENRFGGGNLAKKGLTRDGELLLEYLNKTNILIDLSHTSDALADGIFNHIEKKGLTLTPIASHSNFRSIQDQKRNLLDLHAKEIFRRGGVVGINFVKAFLGKTIPEAFQRHIEYGRFLGEQGANLLWG